jgi:hypothetical protein
LPGNAPHIPSNESYPDPFVKPLTDSRGIRTVEEPSDTEPMEPVNFSKLTLLDAAAGKIIEQVKKTEDYSDDLIEENILQTEDETDEPDDYETCNMLKNVSNEVDTNSKDHFSAVLSQSSVMQSILLRDLERVSIHNKQKRVYNITHEKTLTKLGMFFT